MALLKDVHPFIAEVLDGKHDDILAALTQSVDARRKKMQAESGIRKGSRIRMTAAAKDIAGREGIVRKVNKTTLTVVLACPTCGNTEDLDVDGMDEAKFEEYRANRCDTCGGFADEWRVSPNCVEALPMAVAS